LTQAKEVHEKAESAYEKRDELRQQLEDLELIVQLKEASLKDTALADRLQGQEAACEKLKSRFQEAKEKLDSLRKELADLDVEPDREGEIITAINVLQAHKQHEQRSQKLTGEVEQEQKLRDDLEKKLEEKALTADLTLSEPLSAGLEEQTAAKISSIEQQLTSLTEEKNKLQVRNKLSEWVNDLEEGNPCPLCGATHHPEVADFASVHRQLAHLVEKESGLQEAGRNLRELRSDIVRLTVSLENAQKGLASRQKELSEHAAQSLPHIPEGYEKAGEDELKNKLAETKRLRARRNELATGREAVEARIEKLRNELDSEERNCQETRSEQRVVSAGMSDKKERIKVLPADKFLTKEVEELKASTARGQQKIADLERNYQQARREEETLRQAYDQKSGTLTSEETFLQQLTERTEEKNESLNYLAKDHDFDTLDAVRALLNTSLDITGEKEALAAFDKKLHSLAGQIQKCEEDTEGQPYEEETHRQVNSDLQALTSTITNTEKQLAVAEKERQRKQEQLEKKNALLKERNTLEIRLGNLTEITNLFRSSGFVKYVSSIRLRELCQAANERFFKLTKNNLSLELNEKDEFIVRDYLNNGRTRLLKTLSGGQTFQAALCLALALAENIRSLNQADQSFFFLDEGFGSLDKDSLRIVFETLKSLRKENRIVGIISHVEELQQEIDLYLKIVNDKDRGSLIGYSWKGDGAM
ncbi:MAG: SbcC/MukB-like Walker B domain-containing protein, partial [Cyclobacteriaceae bacterium]